MIILINFVVAAFIFGYFIEVVKLIQSAYAYLHPEF